MEINLLSSFKEIEFNIMFNMGHRVIALLGLVVAVVGFENSSDDEWSRGLYEFLDMQNLPDGEDYVSPYSGSEDLIVDFMLYTRENVQNYTKIKLDDEDSIKNLDFSKDLKIIIHGWRNGYDSPLGEILKDAYLSKYDVNVIVLDWSSRSFRNYVGSRMAVPKIGEEVALLIEELVKRGLDLDKVHLIGHSLGAHVAGIAGLRLQSGQISRITGLDPAAPMFTLAESDVLKPFSAKFVDVIHTCGYMLGFISPLGHADFYPNKGTPAQPGCGFDYKGECSHSRAYELFADSINSEDEMLAVKCKDSTAFEESKCSTSHVPMGEYTPTTARGSFFLHTNSKVPYGKGATTS